MMVPPTVIWPLAASLLLGVLPRIAAERRWTLILGPLACLVTLVLALAALWPPTGAGVPGVWLRDPLARSIPVMLALAPLLALPAAAGQRGAVRQAAAMQLLIGGAMVAVQADPLFLMLIAMTVMLLSVPMLSGRDPAALTLGSGGVLLLGWLGSATFSFGLREDAGWRLLGADFAAIPPGLRLSGFLLLTAPMILLAWFGTLPRSASSGRALPMPPVLPLMLGVPAMNALLRLRGLPEPDPALFRIDMLALGGLGLLMAALAALRMIGRQPGEGDERATDRHATIAAIQLGLVALGFAAGGNGGIVGGLMVLFFLGLALPIAAMPASNVAGERMRRLAALALVGMPPFGIFAGDLVLLLSLFANAPLAALAMLAALCVAALSLLDHRPPAAATPTSSLSLASALFGLVLLAWLGIAMPASVSDWLFGVSERFVHAGLAAPARGAR